MRVLVACEFSGIVREEFRKLGHDAWSCDLEDTEIEGNHYKCDVREVLSLPWDLMIAHPPCTHLACSGAKHFWRKEKEQKEALDFVRLLLNSNIEKIALENPIGVISTKIRKPDQIIQPWMFGEPYQKTTCLWLKHLDKLEPTNIVDKGEFIVYASGRKLPKWYSNLSGKDRSRTFQGIAIAMAEQWGGKLE